MRRAHDVMITTMAVVALTAPAALAGPAPGGQEGMDGRNSGQGHVEGPDSPGLGWISEDIEDHRVGRDRNLSLDSAGHVLVQGQDDAVDDSAANESLTAVDAADGTIAWQTHQIEDDCDVAASDDGLIFAQVETGSGATDLVAIDAATGGVLADRTYVPEETDADPQMTVCNDGLRLLEDGTLVVVDRNDIRALDTTTTPISLMWADDTRTRVSGRPPASPDASRIYLLWQDTSPDPNRMMLDAVDVASGDVIESVQVPGDTHRISNSQGDALLVDRDGGIVFSTDDRMGTGVGGDDVVHLTRMTPGLDQDWVLTVGPDRDADPFFPNKDGFMSLVEAGDRIAGWFGGGHIAAVDRATGDPVWILKPDSFTNNEGRIVADAAGNVYWSTFGGNSLQSADPDGVLRYSLPECSFQLGEAKAIGPIADDGTLYVLDSKKEDGEPNDLQVTAITQGAPLPQGECPERDERLGGATRFETAIEIAQSAYPQDGSADVVLLARSDVFADALAGTPLAVQENGPLLVTPTDRLLPEVAAEIQRLLGNNPSKTVILLGGTAALSSGVQSSAAGLGYQTDRIAGTDRIETATEVADELDQVDAFLVTTGFNFPDALAAGPAAAEAGGAVLLTFPSRRSPVTDAYMDARPNVARFAIGGPAARSYEEATKIFGPTRTATAVAVARHFFDSPPAAGIARSDTFPDSLTGGGHIATGIPELARRGGPMLLTSSTSLAGDVAAYLCDEADSLQRVFIYGGTGAVDESVATAARQRISGSGC